MKIISYMNSHLSQNWEMSCTLFNNLKDLCENTEEGKALSMKVLKSLSKRWRSQAEAWDVVATLESVIKSVEHCR